MTLPPTLALEDAARRAWEVVVVGAGPAGALAARELARRSAYVLLVDKSAFPRWKVCGSCLNGRALATLAAAGLAALPARLGGVPLTRFEMAAAGYTARLPLPVGVAISREAFDAALVKHAIDAGAHFLPETEARLSPADAPLRRVALRNRSGRVDVAAHLVLAADGLGSCASAAKAPTTRSSGALVGVGVLVPNPPEHYRRGTIYMACSPCGYVGLVRLEDGRLDVAAALHPGCLPGCGAGAAVEAALCEAGLPPVPGLTKESWRGTPSLTRRAARLADHRLFLLGDAAGYVEPFTGEGIAWALAAAVAVVPLALQAVNRWESRLTDQWTRVYQREVARRQLLCRALTAVLRRPSLTRAMTLLLAHAPRLATPFIRHLNTSSLSWAGQQS